MIQSTVQGTGMTILTEDLDGNNMIGLEGHPVTNQINTGKLLVFLTVLNDCSFIYYIHNME